MNKGWIDKNDMTNTSPLRDYALVLFEYINFT